MKVFSSLRILLHLRLARTVEHDVLGLDPRRERVDGLSDGGALSAEPLFLRRHQHTSEKEKV